MKRVAVASLSLLLIVLSAPAARADHVPTSIAPPAPLPIQAPLLSEGNVRHIANVQAGNGVAAPLGERGPFSRDGRKYFAASSTHYGLHIVDVTDPLSPQAVSTFSSSFGCPTASGEAYADGSRDPLAPLSGFENDQSVTPDGRFAVIGMDAAGRCHDPRFGGVELVDLTDLTNPRAVHLTRNIGEAHSITFDPKRPFLAYTSTSDGFDLIDVIDFRSCYGGVAALGACKPVVARIPFTKRHWPNVPMNGANDVATDGCHDIRFQGDLLYCAAVEQTSIIDVSKILDAKGRLTGTHLTSGPNACPVLPATRTAPGVKVTDCTGWTETAFEERKAKGANARLVSIIEHDGSRPPTEDISIAHQAEPTHDGNIMFVTDERGGGVTNEAGCPGGGVFFYDIRNKAKPVLMQQPDGSPAIYITPTNIPGTAHMSCTVHYGEQVGKENLFVFGWYLNGLRVVRVTPDYSTKPATLTIEEVAAYLPVGGYVIQAKPLMRNPANPSELIVYTADEARGMDVIGVTAPKILLKGPSSVAGGAQVKGKTHRRDLAATGVGDPVTVSLMLLVIAVFVVRRLRSAPL